MQFESLINVTDQNNNKFYKMTEQNDCSFLAEWGRVGGHTSSKVYSMNDWDKVLSSKLKKGYTRITENVAIKTSETVLKIDDLEVKSLIEFLMQSSKTHLSNSYLGSTDSVTQKQIDLAQNAINELSLSQKKKCIDKDTINAQLLNLYKIIPRKMSDTRNYLLKNADKDFFAKLLVKEQELLDTLSSQVQVNHIDTKEITLESLGFDVEVASQSDRDRIAKETDFRVGNQRIFKVTNKETEKVFRTDIKSKLLYHGSRNENWLSILMTGLKIRPNGVSTNGSMFGDGIYGANKARKSIGYTSLKGSYWTDGNSNKAYLAIFEFALGKTWNVLSNGKSYDYSLSNLTEEKVNKHHCNSVYAEKGADLRNDEYIVYNGNQCTIRYLIELTE